jgi:prepilin-type N-terminal cleavage/methylation domain-containing protein/prepilin-type processing-associated H-X9-DG protein
LHFTKVKITIKKQFPLKIKNLGTKSMKTNTGFTFIELLVVLGVLSLLAATGLTSMASAKQKAENATCMNNFQQVTAAWQFYANDYRGNLCPMPNSGVAVGWCYGGMDYAGGVGATNTAFIVDKRYALLGPYIKNAKHVKCPTDMSTQYINKRGLPRVRSLSVNQAVGVDATTYSVANSGLWLNGGASHGSWTVFVNQSDIARMSASKLWVFIDEHPDSINDGGFGVTMAKVSWVDVPTSLHNNGFNLSYADGHVEQYKLTHPEGVPSVNYYSYTTPVLVSDNQDILWLQARTSCH